MGVYAQGRDSAFPDIGSPIASSETDDLPQQGYTDPYTLATDAQIIEAQDFYQTCKKNTTMSARKDCRCAAASYLETRIKLGDSATVGEIMQENLNTCLLDESKSAVSDPQRLDLDKITEQQKEEAESVYYSCKDSRRMSLHVDCECLAAKFLDLRIKRGSVTPRHHLISEITIRQCRNVVELTGVEYAKCMRGSGFDYSNIRPKDYCECYARKWGELFDDYEGKMDANKKTSFRIRARSHCKNPNIYKP
ncbi:MAG: hypothetical protein ACLFP8_05685 [Alphaproteobacteria bacterium]